MPLVILAVVAVAAFVTSLRLRADPVRR
jgi:hypothetical protein